MICEECNFYTEEFNPDLNDNDAYCLKDRQFITEDEYKNECINFNNDLNCYDCPERYEQFYEIDDIDHYCKKLNCLIFRQQRSVLYKGDFKKKC
jgi:hypothetical protein